MLASGTITEVIVFAENAVEVGVNAVSVEVTVAYAVSAGFSGTNT